MKRSIKYYLTIFIFLFCINLIKSQDYSKKTPKTNLHLGIIPYQLFSRSSGIYCGLSKGKIGLEYRPTYTYATNYWSMFMSSSHKDWFYFKGINNNLLITLVVEESINISLIGGYKYWWYNKQTIKKENGLNETKSSKIEGFAVGMEVSFEVGNRDDFLFFFNSTYNKYNGTTTLYGNSGTGYKTPIKKPYRYEILSYAFGVKIGLKTKIGKNKENS